jgi:hypothetical protein
MTFSPVAEQWRGPRSWGGFGEERFKSWGERQVDIISRLHIQEYLVLSSVHAT